MALTNTNLSAKKTYAHHYRIGLAYNVLIQVDLILIQLIVIVLLSLLINNFFMVIELYYPLMSRKKQVT